MSIFDLHSQFLADYRDFMRSFFSQREEACPYNHPVFES